MGNNVVNVACEFVENHRFITENKDEYPELYDEIIFILTEEELNELIYYIRMYQDDPALPTSFEFGIENILQDKIFLIESFNNKVSGKKPSDDEDSFFGGEDVQF